MRIRKYDFNYGRRMLMEKTIKGVAGAGVLASLWPLVSKGGDATKAYPDELLSIEMYTKGKFKPGDMITADNVDAVKELLDPFVFTQIKNYGRKIKLRASTKDVHDLLPKAFLEASLRNQGKAKFGPDGNVYAPDGGPWMGGAPFLDIKTGQEAMVNLAMSWGKHDYCQYAIRETDIGPDGKVAYTYDFCKVELQVTNRVDGKIFQNRKDLMRYHVFLFTAQSDVAGTSFLDIWHYDQRQFPDLYGFLPQFKRVRQFPTNQRFEPLVPGVTWFLTDPWAAGDPAQTWGNIKIVERKPMLAAMSGNWSGSKPEWTKGYHGGKGGITFMDTEYELVPEMLVVELEPTGYTRAPASKKVVWIDARNGMYNNCARYDRQGKPWVCFETGSGLMVDGNAKFLEPTGEVAWSWSYVMCWDAQTNRMSRIEYKPVINGGFKTELHGDAEEKYQQFCTQQAIQRLGQM